MVTVLRTRSLKFKINAREHNPPHVHVEGMGCALRVNLATLEPLDETGFSKATVALIIETIKQSREELLRRWEEYHGNQRD